MIMKNETQLPAEFHYGKAIGRVMRLENAPRKNARSIGKRMQVHINVLELNIDIPPEDTRRAIVHDNGPDKPPNVFLEVYLGGQSHFLTTRSLSEGENQEEQLRKSLGGKKPEIHIVSGPCLFSAESVQAMGINGTRFALTKREENISEPITHIIVNEKLSQYETEAIERLGSVINNLAKNNPHIRKVLLNIPQAEYYLFALDGYQKGFITQAQMLEWFDNVDKRHQRQMNLLGRRLKDGNHVLVEESSPLLGIKEYIRNSIKRGDVPHFEDAIRILSEQNILWKDMFDVSNITSWQDIIDLSYIHAELFHAEQHGEKATFTLAVENPTESKILDHAKIIAKKLQAIRPRVFHLAGFFPHELWVVDHDQHSDEAIRRYNQDKTMYHLKEDPKTKPRVARDMIGVYRRRSS